MCFFVLVNHVLAQAWRHFGRRFTIHSPIDFLAYRFILVYVAPSDFHIGVMYYSGFFSLGPTLQLSPFLQGSLHV